MLWCLPKLYRVSHLNFSIFYKFFDGIFFSFHLNILTSSLLLNKIGLFILDILFHLSKIVMEHPVNSDVVISEFFFDHGEMWGCMFLFRCSFYYFENCQVANGAKRCVASVHKSSPGNLHFSAKKQQFYKSRDQFLGNLTAIYTPPFQKHIFFVKLATI